MQVQKASVEAEDGAAAAGCAGSARPAQGDAVVLPAFLQCIFVTFGQVCGVQKGNVCRR